MTAPDFDSEAAREARFRHFYDLPAAGDLTEAMLEESLSVWRRCDMSEAFVESLVSRLESVRVGGRPCPPDTDAPVEHRQTMQWRRLIRDHGGADVSVSCGCRAPPPSQPPAQVITHPSALEATLKASIDAAERGELPSQRGQRQRWEGERESKLERLHEEATWVLKQAPELTTRFPRFARLVERISELNGFIERAALGAEEE